MERFYLENPQGEKLHTAIHAANPSPIVTIVIHSKGEDKESQITKEMVEHLVVKEHNIITFDFSGHGLSEGERANANQKKQFSDIDTVIEYAKKKYRQIGIIGHSQGAFIATNYVSNQISQGYNIAHLANISLLTQNPDELSQTEEAISHITCPTLFAHGTKDEITPSSETEQLFKAAHEPKELFLILDGDHKFSLNRHRESLISQTEYWLSSLH